MYMINKDDFSIRKAQIQDWDKAVELAWKTFLKFESKDYGAEGTKNFRDFLADEMLKRMFIIGKYVVFVAEVGDQIVGMISLRNINHISLLFIDAKYHKNGIGSDLLGYVERYLKAESQEKIITVDAAPYAIGFYHRLNFMDTSPEQCREGIRYTSMEKRI